MPKRHQQNKSSYNNRTSSSMSIGQESQNQVQEQIGSASFGTDLMPTYEDIQRRAYQIHEEKGGNDLENWLEAERVLKEEQNMSRSI